MKSALARAMRILQPPEKSSTFVCCIFASKPRPSRMVAARGLAVAASMSSSWSVTSIRRSWASVRSKYGYVSSKFRSSPIFLRIIKSSSNVECELILMYILMYKKSANSNMWWKPFVHFTHNDRENAA